MSTAPPEIRIVPSSGSEQLTRPRDAQFCFDPTGRSEEPTVVLARGVE